MTERGSGMDLGTHVVCFGYEPVLLESRRKVLATRFHAISVATLEALEQTISHGDVKVLVICHTVPEADCLAAVAMANDSADDIRAVLLTFDRAPRYATVQTIRVYEGPEALLNRVSELLSEKRFVLHPTESNPTMPLSYRPVLQPAEELRGEAPLSKRRSCRPQT